MDDNGFLRFQSIQLQRNWGTFSPLEATVLTSETPPRPWFDERSMRPVSLNRNDLEAEERKERERKRERKKTQTIQIVSRAEFEGQRLRCHRGMFAPLAWRTAASVKPRLMLKVTGFGRAYAADLKLAVSEPAWSLFLIYFSSM